MAKSTEKRETGAAWPSGAPTVVQSEANALCLALLNGRVDFLVAVGVMPREGEEALRAALKNVLPTEDAVWMAIGLAALADANENSPENGVAVADNGVGQEARRAGQKMAEGIHAIQERWPAPANRGATVWGRDLHEDEDDALRSWALFREWSQAIIKSKIGAPECGMLADRKNGVESQKAWKILAGSFNEIAPALREAWRGLTAPEKERSLGGSETIWLRAAARANISLGSVSAAEAGLLRWPSLAEAESVEASGERESLLIRALRGGHASIARMVLARSPLDAVDERGATALIHAAWSGEAEIALWIAQRSDARHTTEENGLNAFMAACMKGHAETAQALLPWADWSRRSRKWGDLLDLALCSDKPATLEWMVARWPGEDWESRREKMAAQALKTHRWAAAQWIGEQLSEAELERFVRTVPEEVWERLPEMRERARAVSQAQEMLEEMGLSEEVSEQNRLERESGGKGSKKDHRRL